MVRQKYAGEREDSDMSKVKERSFLVGMLALCATAGTVMAGVDEGKQVFADKKCITCHSLGDQKGAAAQLGGALDHVGSKRDADWLKGYLVDPKSKMPDAKMPKQKLTDKELDDLVAYMLSLQ
jgi:nitric oxide reductase subunit C